MEQINISPSLSVKYESAPDRCPVCHHAVEPVVVGGRLTQDSSSLSSQLHVAFQCPQRQCRSLFIGYYGYFQHAQYRLRDSGPFTPVPPSVPEEVKAISTNFTAIYTQAAAAEGYRLTEIAGVGYRKALEFLVKDYCTGEHPGDEDDIKAQPLGAVIGKYVDDANIKACAQRAAWLGNDETHYVRRWADKDLKDLKTLLELTMGWIRSDALTKQYLADMEKPGTPLKV